MVDRHGHPLMACHRARARKLLSSARARACHLAAFVIRLVDREAKDSEVPGVELGMDPGSEQTGISVYQSAPAGRVGLCSFEIEHRGQHIREEMGQRAGCPRRRRTVNLRYRKPRFDNRTKPEGWLAPSLRHRVDNSMSTGTRLRRWAPVVAVCQELVRFDTQQMEHPEGSGVDDEQGTLAGFEVREHLLCQWERRCAYCGAEGIPPNLDHIVPRSKGGTNRGSNLALARVPCNRERDDQELTGWPAQRFGEGDTPGVVSYPATVALARATGPGSYSRTRPDAYGFSRLYLRRTKGHHGYATGDLVRAVVPSGKKPGVYVGRVAVRSSGSFNIKTKGVTVQGISHRHCTLLQRGDGWEYGHREEVRASGPSGTIPPQGSSRGFLVPHPFLMTRVDEGPGGEAPSVGPATWPPTGSAAFVEALYGQPLTRA